MQFGGDVAPRAERPGRSGPGGAPRAACCGWQGMAPCRGWASWPSSGELSWRTAWPQAQHCRQLWSFSLGAVPRPPTLPRRRPCTKPPSMARQGMAPCRGWASWPSSGESSCRTAWPQAQHCRQLWSFGLGAARAEATDSSS